MTAQFPDKVLVDGTMQMLFSCPLEAYFDEEHPRPEFFRPASTACWRGYVAWWEVADGKLYLTRVMDQTTETDVLKQIFPDAGERVLASWVTDILRLPQGEQLRYVHMGFRSEYERDLLLTVEQGVVTERSEVDNRELEVEVLVPPSRPGD